MLSSIVIVFSSLPMLYSHSPEPPCDTSHTDSCNIPDNKLAIYSTRAHSVDGSVPAYLIRSYARNRVLVDSEKFGVCYHIAPSSVAARIRIPERVKCRTVQSANSPTSRSGLGSARGGVVQCANERPACFRTREHHRLAVMTCSYNRAFGSPGECDIRQSTDTDVVYGRASRIDDVDRAVVACQSK